MQLRNYFDKCMLWFWCVSLIFLFMKIILVVCGFSRDIRVVYASLLFMRFGCLCLAYRTWSGYESTGPLRAWVGMEVLDPLRAFVKVVDCCDPSFAGTLTCAKLLQTYVESAFGTVSERFTIADHFYFVLVRTIRSNCIASSQLIK
jgi:hypothetical protein